MTDLKTKLAESLNLTVPAGHTAGVSAVAQKGAEPQAFWVPESEEEPLFLAYSITKTLIATLVLKLCEEGRLTLDDRLAKWFPHIAEADRISLVHLLNHTAGIPDYGGILAYHDEVRRSPSEPWPFDRFAAETFEKGLRFEPGYGWAYSNPGYMLLKGIVEKVTETTLRVLVSENITDPLGLRRTFVPESIEDLASLARGTSCALSPDSTPRDVRKYYHPGWVSHGVVASSPSEIARFLDGLFHGQLLSRRSLEQMTELIPVSAPAGDTVKEPPVRWGKPSYGLGLMGDPASPWGLVVGHNGGGPCYSASAFHAIDLGGVSVCSMSAADEAFKPEDVVFRVFDHVAGLVPEGAAQPGR